MRFIYAILFAVAAVACGGTSESPPSVNEDAGKVVAEDAGSDSGPDADTDSGIPDGGVCAPGSTQCVSAFTYTVCTANGEWNTTDLLPCPSGTRCNAVNSPTGSCE